ncbi:MAG: BCCT family transporter, partial [Pseudomonadota bacterium]|nr:BCCT family transporter [Pseudomonadota bacterium]
MSSSSTALPVNNTTGLQRLGDPVVLSLTMGFILLFVGWSLNDAEGLASVIGAGFGWTAKYLGSFLQLVFLATFLIALGVGFCRSAQAPRGGRPQPAIGTVPG